MIDFDLLAFKRSNHNILDLRGFHYSELSFMFQSIINNCEILPLLIDSIKSEIKNHYFLKEDFTETIIHYLALNRKDCLVDYLKTMLKKDLESDLDLQFSWDFIDKNQKCNITYSFDVSKDEKPSEEVLTKINFVLDINPLKGVPLYKVKRGDEILAKPVTENFQLIRQIQTDYEEKEEPKSVWVFVKDALHQGSFTKLIVSVKDIIGEISEEENHIKVNLKKNKKNEKKVENIRGSIFERIVKKNGSPDIKHILFFCIIFLSVIIFLKYL